MDANLQPTQHDDPNRPAQGFEVRRGGVPLHSLASSLASLTFQYLDHTADVQLHAWGQSLQEAFEQAVKAMFGYMTDLDTIEENGTHVVEAHGHDEQSALFAFLDEWLFAFAAEPNFVPFKVRWN
jgi:hypothetical protein